ESRHAFIDRFQPRDLPRFRRRSLFSLVLSLLRRVAPNEIELLRLGEESQHGHERVAHHVRLAVAQLVET
ncbi:hypothetical protein PFISCL1PPCAC_4222, partial [Pristionchus fissidentatus]